MNTYSRRVTKPQWVFFWLMTFVAGILIGVAFADDSEAVCKAASEWVKR